MDFTTTDEFWHSPYHCCYEDAAIRLLQFSDGPGTPLLIVPPQAGHHSYIADYDHEQSLVQCAIENTNSPVFAVEWKSCTFERRHEGISDLVMQLATAVSTVGVPVHLVGLCQGGWLSTIYTVLHPQQVASLTIAGTPIDTHAGESVLHQVVRLPLYVYQSMVAWGGGLMNGGLMLMGWKSANTYQHYIKRYQEGSAKAETFYKWYDYTQDLAGGWYLWAIKSLFKDNLLGRNELTIAGRHIDLTTIRCPVRVVTGKGDDITPSAQSLRLLDYTQGEAHEINAGHIGVFMGRQGISSVWSKLFAAV